MLQRVNANKEFCDVFNFKTIEMNLKTTFTKAATN